jgi:hypothetical protein
MVVLLPLEIGTFMLIGHFSKAHLVPFEQADFSRDVVAHRLMLEGYFGMFSILIAYFLLTTFIRKEGIRILGRWLKFVWPLKSIRHWCQHWRNVLESLSSAEPPFPADKLAVTWWT